MKKAGKVNALQTAKKYKKNKIGKICPLLQIQDKAILLDTGLFFEDCCASSLQPVSGSRYRHKIDKKRSF